MQRIGEIGGIPLFQSDDVRIDILHQPITSPAFVSALTRAGFGDLAHCNVRSDGRRRDMIRREAARRVLERRERHAGK